MPSIDSEPTPTVRAVVLYNDDPELARWIRIPGGWSKRGYRVNYYIECTPPFAWPEIGVCWDGVEHAVVAVSGRG